MSDTLLKLKFYRGKHGGIKTGVMAEIDLDSEDKGMILESMATEIRGFARQWDMVPKVKEIGEYMVQWGNENAAKGTP